ncbi:hypothetical protein [Spirosoma sordidisoli]|uniref:Lipocalin-like domain-containing protein n=1 Tax=Spirosoma sordidisoli TaxID=2502893 RepID=A0A4Q2UGU4_9BACT|nr:hypothetical protein [Spirosoma sordidisoli]RYC66631.1 hypothetical protein EQG79_28995 [Spirosoma sordidisoli]
MKTITLLFLLLCSLVSCQKSSNENIVPDIAGVYSITTLRNMENEVLNFPTLSTDGKAVITSEIEITKIDNYQINILRKGIAYGTSYTDPLGLFDIRKDGSEYVVYKDGLYIGSLNGSKVYLNFAGKSKNTMISSILADR